MPNNSNNIKISCFVKAICQVNFCTQTWLLGKGRVEESSETIFITVDYKNIVCFVHCIIVCGEVKIWAAIWKDCD